MTIEKPSALVSAVYALRDARIEEGRVATLLKERQAAFDKENAALLASVKDAKSTSSAADTALRAIALEAYKTTKEKKPTPGVEVKMRTIYTYDANKAFEWAREKKMALLPERLDVPAFEKIVTATKIDFVTIDEEPAVQIASDLVKHIGADPLPVAQPTPTPEPAPAPEREIFGTVVDDDDDDLPF